MAKLQNRTHVVYVRVSDAELRQFQDLCKQQQARNMSDLVRSAVEMMTRQRAGDFENEVTLRLQRLEEGLNHLGIAMERLTAERTA